MSDPKQGSGQHLPHGSIQAELTRLQGELLRARAMVFDRDIRIRALEGALRDCVAPLARAAKVLG